MLTLKYFNNNINTKLSILIYRLDKKCTTQICLLVKYFTPVVSFMHDYLAVNLLYLM